MAIQNSKTSNLETIRIGWKMHLSIRQSNTLDLQS